MNKYIWILTILAIIIVVLLGIFIFVPPTIVERPAPIGTDGLSINLLRPNQEISSPLKITGSVTGNGWSGFEGQVGTVRLLSSNGSQIGQTAILTATTDWMQAKISFETTLNFQSSIEQSGTIVFHNENASGDPIRDKTFSLPVKIKSSGETTTVKAYFGKTEVTGSTCTVVFPVDRLVLKTQAVARAALEELLKGPTEAEKSQGYFTNINPGVKIQSLTIDANGTARADFSSELETTGGSCRVTEIRSEINFTLKQFSTIKNVIISINGRTEDILQP